MAKTDGRASTDAAAQPYYTMYFDQSAHLDWDWLGTFAQNYWYYTNGSGVDAILRQAITNVGMAGGAGGAYYYTICEMGFFRRYIEEHPEAKVFIPAFKDNFQVLSGGVTSADCLVCSGEGFIRNYLVGQVWLNDTLGMTAKPHCWLPDDFGQGPELPALLSALGFVSMSFSRLPGPQPNEEGLQVGPMAKLDPPNPAYDFVWLASDGSSVYAHWMPRTYGIGTQYFKKESPNQAIADLVALYGATGTAPQRYVAAATPLMYIPFDDDFTMPTAGLQAAIDAWDAGPEAGTSNVAVRQGTFDQFMTDLIAAQEAAAPSQQPLAAFAYNGTPYWTGYYASRPALKIHHYEAVRALVAAEIFGLLTQPSNPAFNNMLPTGFWSDLDEAWTQFAPSTHHDFVTGTAPDAVYAGDQLPLLRGVAERGRALRAAALNALAGMTGGDYGIGVIVANSLGFGRQAALAEISGVALGDPNSVTAGYGSVAWKGPNANESAVQRSAEGGMLFLADVPSFGYQTGSLSYGSGTPPATPATIDPETTATVSLDGDSYVLKNEFLTATISAAADWGVAGLTDSKNGGAPVFAGIGNAIALFQDSGGIYQFGDENGGTMTAAPVTISVKGPGLGAVVLETGPVRVRIRTTILVTIPKLGQYYYTREYALVAGEPFLRMTTTGAAPSGHSVMTVFPLASPATKAASAVTSMDHGTPGHWTSVQPLDVAWGPPVFRPTHDFVLPRDSQLACLGAVYHGGIPAWAFDTEGSLIGCLFRNTPTNAWGAAGTDPAIHTQHYAFRVPSNLGGPDTGQPLQEALGFNTPLQAQEVACVGNYPKMLTAASANLAAVASPSSAILTVAKPGSYHPENLVLRLYQPTNAPVSVTVTLPASPSFAPLITATEQPLPGAPGGTPTSTGFTVTMNNAIATVMIPGAGRPSAAEPSIDTAGAPITDADA